MRLTVVTQDRLSAWEEKGEIVQGYFNPANRFDAVDIVLLNDDSPSPQLLKILCGEVPFRIFNLPLITPKLMITTLGWRSFLIKFKLGALFKWISLSPPDVIRAYETNLASYCANAIAKKFNRNYAISLHSTPDKIALKSFSTFKDRLVRSLTGQAGRLGINGAHKILAVYGSIIKALPQELAKKTVVVPNAVGVHKDHIKIDYGSRGPIKLVTTGRLVPGKSPEIILKALAEVENTELTIIGDGPLRNSLIEEAGKLNISDRVTFIKRMDNKSLCAALSGFDAFAFRTDYQECPKTVIEAALVGLPIICPKDLQLRVPELQGLSLITCEDNPKGFSKVICSIRDEKFRRANGQKIAEAAQRLWSPQSCADKAADILMSLVKNNNL